MIPYQRVFQALHDAGVNYLVAGGFAVNFHQVQRATVDLDLIIRIERSNILLLVEMMKSLGFVPRVPVNPMDFADDAIRQSWISEKGMMVFSYLNPANPFEVIDIFANEPRPFADLWQRRVDISAFGLQIPVVGKADLIDMKSNTGRDKDRFDVEQLKKS